MTVTNDCPKPAKLTAFIDGTLSHDEQTSVQAHVDGCDACQRALESLVAGGESVEAAVEHLRHEFPAPNDEALSGVMNQLKGKWAGTSPERRPDRGSPLDVLTPSDYPGSLGRLGTYEVTEVIGQGGMGIVFKAFDPALHRVVAVKMLAPYLAYHPNARKRFVREAQAVAAVSHDHVITIYAIDDSAEQAKIVMQYVPGRSLQQKIDEEGSLELKEILRIGMQTAAGLAAAHAQGLVHRDVKPSNILLENSIQRVKLTDFGLARAVDDASLTQSGVIAGTPQYMAPEQANGDAVDFRADLFSLGSVLYAMCVGHSPFRASTTMGVLKRVCHDPPRPILEGNPDIPDWFCAIVMKLLSKNPQDRFPTAKAVAERLEHCLAYVQQPQTVPPPGPWGHDSPAPVGRMPPRAKSGTDNASLDFNPFVAPPSESILFQRVNWRLFLSFFLLAWFGWMTFIYAGTHNLGEAILLGVLGGLVTSCWLSVVVAAAVFFAHQVRQWIAPVSRPTGTNPQNTSALVVPSKQRPPNTKVEAEQLTEASNELRLSRTDSDQFSHGRKDALSTHRGSTKASLSRFDLNSVLLLLLTLVLSQFASAFPSDFVISVNSFLSGLLFGLLACVQIVAVRFVWSGLIGASSWRNCDVDHSKMGYRIEVGLTYFLSFLLCVAFSIFGMLVVLSRSWYQR